MKNVCTICGHELYPGYNALRNQPNTFNIPCVNGTVVCVCSQCFHFRFEKAMEQINANGGASIGDVRL